MLLALAAAMAPTGWFALMPGAAVPLLPRVSTGRPAGPPSGGEVLMLTVEARPVRLGRLLATSLGLWPGGLARRSQLIPAGMSDREYHQFGLDLMQESISLAAVVALRARGYDGSVYGEGARVLAVTSPGAGGSGAELRPGDLIVMIGNDPVRLGGDLRAPLRNLGPGDLVQVGVVRSGQLVQVQVRLVPAPQGAEEMMLGVLVRSALPRLALAFPVQVDAAGISGPSGGLAMALAIYHAIGSGDDPLGGRVVAASGFLRQDGSVGPVGLIALKAQAAAKAGATLLLVAPADAEEARRAAPGIEVVAVERFDQALAYLKGLGAPRPGLAPR